MTVLKLLGLSFLNTSLKNQFCVSIKGSIIHESSCQHLKQNEIAKTKNGHLQDQTRALLFQKKNVPKNYWGENVLTATYLINRLPFSVLGFKSPMEIISSFYPNVSTTNNLTPWFFRCVSFVQVHSQGRGKLDPRALK
ncbi:hypothetical protein CR513_57335, partial [Mucuna pruriens]